MQYHTSPKPGHTESHRAPIMQNFSEQAVYIMFANVTLTLSRPLHCSTFAELVHWSQRTLCAYSSTGFRFEPRQGLEPSLAGSIRVLVCDASTGTHQPNVRIVRACYTVRRDSKYKPLSLFRVVCASHGSSITGNYQLLG